MTFWLDPDSVKVNQNAIAKYQVKLYCLVTEAHRCEQLAQGCNAASPRAGFQLKFGALTCTEFMLYGWPHRHRSVYNIVGVHGNGEGQRVKLEGLRGWVLEEGMFSAPPARGSGDWEALQ